jgi:hypothetical protein
MGARYPKFEMSKVLDEDGSHRRKSGREAVAGEKRSCARWSPPRLRQGVEGGDDMKLGESKQGLVDSLAEKTRGRDGVKWAAIFPRRGYRGLQL